MSFYTYDEAEGRLKINDWEQLLIEDGFPATLFNKKHQDCPICSAPKSFRAGQLSKKAINDSFRYVCSKCTASEYKTGFEFLAAFHHLHTSTDVYRYIYQEILKGEPATTRVLPQAVGPRNVMTPEMVQKSLRTNGLLWSKSHGVREGDAVWKYLNRRLPNIRTIPDDIHITKAQYWEHLEGQERPVLLGEFYAMILRGFSPCGKLVQLHTTFLTEDGHKAPVTNVKKTRPGNGYSSFAFRIGVPVDGVLGVCEGVETALSAWLLHDMTVWPCHSAAVLANFEVPDIYKNTVQKIVIFADNDRSKLQNGNIRNTGYQAAEKLAKKLRSQGYKVVIMLTGRIGDFNDHYLAMSAPKALPSSVAQLSSTQHSAYSKFADVG